MAAEGRQGKLKTYRELEVWQKAMDLVVAVYDMTGLFPDDERFGLTSQLRRASVSIAANITEGYGRMHQGDYLRHLSFARGSVMEVETHVIISVRTNMIEREKTLEVWDLTQQVGKMLARLINSIKTLNPKP